MKLIWLCLLCPIMLVSQTDFKEVNQLFEDKNYAQAAGLLNTYLEQNPKNLEAIELLGDAYGHQEKWDEALVYYKQLLETDSYNANYHYKYGGVLGMKALENKFKAIGFIGDVKSSFLKAAELDRSHIGARWALVELYMQLPGIIGGSKKKALEFAEQLENLSKVDGYLAKGYIYEYDDEPELAENYYKKAIVEGGSVTCYNKLISFYEGENAPEKALQTAETAQKKHQRNALHYQIGKIAAEYNIELQKGLRCLETYIQNYSAEDGVPIAWAHYRLAQIYTYKNNKSRALKYIDLAIEALPEIKLFKKQKDRILAL
ncbi:tetratricopeptide repeat protein [Tamlana fucoidanivorans]|uniref:Tetratricopeptide repeat protein n=1 Tax=Allotamlana fucoidanivorans TaxID=2583814 RepID=A0A5C4SIX7_9FLAO|nr:tetratricopeptide repeat protein [Tamlana fucoidanivorans]TNJ43780.1 tetratricopeptide repeat protein [Tamlana fucoidanivorans]